MNWTCRLQIRNQLFLFFKTYHHKKHFLANVETVLCDYHAIPYLVLIIKTNSYLWQNFVYISILGVLLALAGLILLQKFVNRYIINWKTIRINYFHDFEIFKN